jgi:succinate dehydrogenase / fumarate reductase, membrane anchor subunit
MRQTYLQIAQMCTGIVIAVLLGLHMVIMHLDAILGLFGVRISDATAFTSMIERSRQGLWAAIYVLLLVFALYHALNGLRNVVLELTSSRKGERITTGVVIFIGVVFLIVGVYTPIALLSSNAPFTMFK